MANRPPKNYVICVQLANNDLAFLRKGYHLYFMHNLEFAQLYTSTKKAEEFLLYLQDIIVHKQMGICIDLNNKNSNLTHITCESQLFIKQINYALVP